MRFSIWPYYSNPWSDTLELVRHCEATGWDGVYFADHFMPNTGTAERADGDVLEGWSVLAALAAAVPRLRLGSLVAGNTYRHPAVLANMAATLDQISGGRFVLGLGAGWQINEHDAYGIPLFGVRDRLDRLEEACRVVTALLRERRATVIGAHYRVVDAPCDPKPVQERLPLLIGGRGERRTLRIVARYADEWNMWSEPPLLAQRHAVLNRHCADVGRDPAEIRVSTQALLFRWDGTGERPRPDVGTRAAMVGTRAELIDTLAAYRDAGADEFILPDWSPASLAERKDTCDWFITEVAAEFR